jgi:hypothetical protein
MLTEQENAEQSQPDRDRPKPDSAAEEAWRWCRANGRSTAAASREVHTALTELKALTTK